MNSFVENILPLLNTLNSATRRDDDTTSDSTEKGGNYLQATMNAAKERAFTEAWKSGYETGVADAIVRLCQRFDIGTPEDVIHSIGLDDVEIKVTRSKATKGATKTTKTTKTKTDKAPKEKWEKPSVPLPWTGTRLANPDTCLGIRPTHNLFSQCVNKRVGDGRYCPTCQKQADGSTTGKPKVGDVEDREAQDINSYTIPGTDKEKKIEQFGNVIEKLVKKNPENAEKFSIDNIQCEALRFGVTIPDDMWTIKKAKRGRKPKDSSSSDESDSENGDVDAKKSGAASLIDAVQEKDDKSVEEDQELSELMDDIEDTTQKDGAAAAPEVVETEPTVDLTSDGEDSEKKFAKTHGYDSDDSVKSAKSAKSDKSKKSAKSGSEKKELKKTCKKAVIGKYTVKIKKNSKGVSQVKLYREGDDAMELDGEYKIKNGKLFDEDGDEVTEDMLDAAMEE